MTLSSNLKIGSTGSLLRNRQGEDISQSPVTNSPVIPVKNNDCKVN
jgi:hypothetical protein